jgi:hypothetical protein
VLEQSRALPQGPRQVLQQVLLRVLQPVLELVLQQVPPRALRRERQQARWRPVPARQPVP